MSRQRGYEPSQQSRRSPIVTKSNEQIPEMRKKAGTLRQRLEIREQSEGFPKASVIHEDSPDEDSHTSDHPTAMIRVLQTRAAMTFDGPDADIWQASLNEELDSIDAAGTLVLINTEDISPSQSTIIPSIDDNRC
jgi:hypothetical protein